MHHGSSMETEHTNGPPYETRPKPLRALTRCVSEDCNVTLGLAQIGRLALESKAQQLRPIAALIPTPASTADDDVTVNCF